MQTEKGVVFFALTDSFDLLRKCMRDLKKCQIALSVQEKIDALFDLAVGIDHLYEWVLKDPSPFMTPAMKEKCGLFFNPYKDTNEAQRTFDKFTKGQNCHFEYGFNARQALVLSLSNGLKHMNKSPRTEKKITEMHFGCGAEDAVCGNYYNQCGMGPTEIISMFLVEGEDLEPLCVDLLAQWCGFFRDIGRELV